MARESTSNEAVELPTEVKEVLAMFATEVRLMSEFTVGEPVTDRQDHSDNRAH